MSQSSLWGHSLKLNKERVRLDAAKFSFSNGVVNEWNTLDDEIISVCSLAGYSAHNAHIASAVLAIAIPSVRLSVRPSHAGIVSKRRHVAR